MTLACQVDGSVSLSFHALAWIWEPTMLSRMRHGSSIWCWIPTFRDVVRSVTRVVARACRSPG